MRKAIRAEYIILLFSLLLMAAYNQSLWQGIIAANPVENVHTFLFLVSCAVFLTALCNLLFNIFALTRLVKPILIVFIIISAISSYFVDSYGVHIDSTMLQNVVETDTAEATELFNLNFLFHLFLWGIAPAILLYRTQFKYASWQKQSIIHLFSMTMSLLAIGLVAAFFYQDYASTFRNHRDLRYLINPTNYIYATSKVIGQQFATADLPLIKISDKAKLGQLAVAKKHRAITVLVVGETARAEQFHINGYERQTTPEIEKLDLINFDDVSSCGTATAVSLPCMFSKFPRDNYDNKKGHGYENLVDVVAAAGPRVLWLDNNSGCKGLCARVESKTLNHLKLPDVCNDEECFDAILLKELDQAIASNNDDMLIILHQKGSHGPAYYKRVPEQFKKFTPVCETSELQQCSQQSIINAYDNTILYTDTVLSDVVAYLKGHSSNLDTAMIYVSDHGESLGEHNMYLHGTPYFFAPSQQTHVPMLMWLSDNYKQDYKVDEVCLRKESDKAYSHDNLFHSVLGLMDIQLPDTYQSDLDMFSSCRTGYEPS